MANANSGLASRAFFSFCEAVGKEHVRFDEESLAEVSRDRTENPGARPAFVVSAATTAEVQAVVRVCHALKLPVTPRVAGMNVGGLALPAEGGVSLDLRRMNRVLEINDSEMYAVVEPGVTWQDITDHLARGRHDLVLGYPLAPPDTSVAAGILMDGLGTLTMAHGPMGEWCNGLEVVLANGEVARVGSIAVSDTWFSRSPLPDLTGLFINWQGITGIVTRLAFTLWPRRAHRRRSVVLCDTPDGGFALMRLGARTGLFDDLGGLSWPTGKMLFGVGKPTIRDPDEPQFFILADYGGDTEEEIRLKEMVFRRCLTTARSQGHRLENPLSIESLVRLNPRFQKFVHFPTRLDFLLDHPGGGITWVGTYGPMSRLEEGARRGISLLEKYGQPPIIVSRPMKQGHFGVLRFIQTFDRERPEEVEKMRALNVEVGTALLELGYVPYKCPASLLPLVLSQMDPGFRSLMQRVKDALDPDGILSPGRWGMVPSLRSSEGGSPQGNRT